MAQVSDNFYNALGNALADETEDQYKAEDFADGCCDYWHLKDTNCPA